MTMNSNNILTDRYLERGSRSQVGVAPSLAFYIFREPFVAEGDGPMMPLGRTIRLFLVDGSPLGLITAEIMNWTGKVLSFPRGLLPQVLKRPEVGKTGIYFLVGPDPENPYRPLVYVGESDDVAKRLKQHDAAEDKDFFEQVALVVSKDENLTKSHVRYLEGRLIEAIRDIGTATLKNGNQGAPVNLPEAEQADVEYILQQLQMLMPVLGYTFLQELPKRTKVTPTQTPEGLSSRPEPITVSEDSPTFELVIEKGSITAEAYEAEGQFILKAGSLVKDPQNDARNPKYRRNIDDALQVGKIQPLPDKPNIYTLLSDMSFSSPSGASDFVCGYSTNGRLYWKLKATNQTYADWRKAQMETATPPALTPEEALV